MLRMPLSLGILLALLGSSWAQGCAAPQALVSELLQRLEGSVLEDASPDPSVLLALNLAGTSNRAVQKLLLEQLKEQAVKRAPHGMASGQVALLVLALLSSCQDPQQVQALGLSVDLLHILQQRTDEELANMEVEGVPRTTLYSVGLDTLTLCLTGVGGYQEASVELAKELLSPSSPLSVDTQAMAVLALVCTHGRTELRDVRDLLQEAVSMVTNGFLDEQEEKGGLIGNIYSMGLAMQALESAGQFYSPRQWDCSQALSVVSEHHFQLPMAMAQLLPALLGRTYLDAASLDCPSGSSASRSLLDASIGMDAPDPISGSLPVESITVQFSITNRLQGKPFSYSTMVRVPDGSTLLRVMEVAAEENPAVYSFQTEQVSWGIMVVSIHGLAGNAEDRTYWQFLSGGDALQEGVGLYKPRDGEHIQAVFSTY
ncbi:cobalamin binding intrinsic factor [Melopsittacus undulatus]|uniref:cobalamin binding intrinsic factor n=1 Tax=Melopsittacus undulatus TaxID=13146 RepID=UPI00146D2490|nr:cobalamin binding intrinsic factor [Melopsittacus undulatus]